MGILPVQLRVAWYTLYSMQLATYTIYTVQRATQEIEPELCITFMSCKRLNLLERNVRSIVAHLEAAEPSIRHGRHPKEHRVVCCAVRCGAVRCCGPFRRRRRRSLDVCVNHLAWCDHRSRTLTGNDCIPPTHHGRYELVWLDNGSNIDDVHALRRSLQVAAPEHASTSSTVVPVCSPLAAAARALPLCLSAQPHSLMQPLWTLRMGPLLTAHCCTAGRPIGCACSARRAACTIRPRHHTAEWRTTHDTQRTTGELQDAAAWPLGGEACATNVYNVGMAGGTNVQNELCGTRSGRAPKCGHAPAVQHAACNVKLCNMRHTAYAYNTADSMQYNKQSRVTTGRQHRHALA
jgi:hypothetical protein